MVAIYESGLFKGDKDEEHMLRSIGLRQALCTCGSAVTQRFISYCQLSCVLSPRRFKLSLRNM